MLAVEMGLRDWLIEVHASPCEDDALAAVTPTYGRKIAQVEVCADFFHRPPEEQRHALIHELIHVHFANQNFAVNSAYERFGAEAKQVAHDAYRLAHESGVDGLTDAIAPHFPLWQQ
jgi:hypothetical protein